MSVTYKRNGVTTTVASGRDVPIGGTVISDTSGNLAPRPPNTTAPVVPTPAPTPTPTPSPAPVSSSPSSGVGSSATPTHTAINPEDGSPLAIGTTVTVNGVRYYGTAPSTPASIALVTATPPTNPANITPTPSPTLPDTTPTAGNIDNATGSIAGLQSWIESQMQIAQDQQTANAATVNNSQNGQQEQNWLSRLISSPSPTEVSNQTWQQTGIDPSQYYADQQAGIAEIGSLTTEYNRIKAAKDQQIAATQDRMGSMNFINNQTAQIERNAAPQLNELSANINSKAAVLQALQGNFNSARDFVNLAVQNATADLKYEFDMYTTFHTLNEDAIAKLDRPYQDALDMKIKIAEMAYTQAVADKTAIGNLMISNPNAGITMSDSIDSAYNKAGLHPSTSSQIIGSADTGYTNVVTDSSGKVISKTSITAGTATGLATSGFSNSKIEADIRQDAVALLESVDMGTLTLDKAYTKLRTLYSPSEATDQSLKNLLGISAPVATPPTPGMPSGNTSPEQEGLINTIWNFLFK